MLVLLAKYMFNHTLCARLHATKSKCRLSVSDTHRPVSSTGLLELCQWSHHIVSESNRVAKNTPGWQPARCTDMSHCWQTASSPAALAQRPPPLLAAMRAPGWGRQPGTEVAAHTISRFLYGQSRVTCLSLTVVGRQSQPLLSPGFQM